MIRTRTRLFSVLAVGALALAGCTGGGDEPPPSPSAGESAPSDGGGTSYATEGPGEEQTKSEECMADDSDQEVPVEAPRADAWPEVNGIGVPVSDTYGPINRDGDVWTCFSHSPTGALFAAAYIQAGLSTAAVRAEYITDDPDLEEGDGDPSTGTSLRGYKFTAYDESTVSIELVVETAGSGESVLVAMPTTLHWNNGWTSTQEAFTSAEPRQITGLSGYTQWSIGS